MSVFLKSTSTPLAPLTVSVLLKPALPRLNTLLFVINLRLGFGLAGLVYESTVWSVVEDVGVLLAVLRLR